MSFSSFAFAQTNEKRGTIKIKMENDTTIYQEGAVDQQPQFPGGMQWMKDYLNKFSNLCSIPPVTFVVEKDGRISFIKIENVNTNGTKECNTELINAIKLMPPWVPGSIKGKLVRVRVKMEFF